MIFFLLFLIATTESLNAPKGPLTRTKRSESEQFSNYVCAPRTMSPALWASIFPTIYAFNGFWRADGNIRIKDSTGNVLLTVNLNGSLWRQYFDASGTLFGELYLNLAGVLVLTSKQTVNPMFSTEKTCQIFLPPSPPNLIACYSELVAPDLAIGYMSSHYMSLIPLGQVFSNEYFNANPLSPNPFSVTVNYATGLFNFPQQEVQFSYTQITQSQASAMGWSTNVANFTSVRGFTAGRGAIPVEVFTPAQREQFGL